jgi:hypothetical protein
MFSDAASESTLLSMEKYQLGNFQQIAECMCIIVHILQSLCTAVLRISINGAVYTTLASIQDTLIGTVQ